MFLYNKNIEIIKPTTITNLTNKNISILLKVI